MAPFLIISVSVILSLVAPLTGFKARHETPANQGDSDQWSAIAAALTDINWPQRKQFADTVSQSITKSRHSLSAECYQSLSLFAHELPSSPLWAIKMLDSNRAWPEGLAEAVGAHFGQYDQCLSIQTPNTVDRKSAFKGQYCLFEVVFPLPAHATKPKRLPLNETMSGTWFGSSWAENYSFLYYSSLTGAICFPSTCSGQEMEQLINSELSTLNISTSVKMWDTCDTQDDYIFNLDTIVNFPLHQKASILVLFLLTALVAISTGLKYIYQDKLDLGLLESFDATANTLKLFQRSKDKVLAKKLAFVGAIRFGYLLVAIAYHVGFVGGIWTPQTHVNLIKFEKTGIFFLDEFTANIGAGISINFVVGGLLAFYTWFPELIKSGRLSFGKFVLARWIRSTPLVIGSILIVWAFPVQWGSGPVWRSGYNNITTTCLTKWWTELLYIANHNQPQETCVIQAWYLSADFQLYIVAYIFLVLLYKRPRLGVAAILLLIFGGVLFQGYIIVKMDTGAYFNASSMDMQDIVAKEGRLHFMAYNYLGPYFIGILLGFAIESGYKPSRRFARILGFFVGPCLVYIIPYIQLRWRSTGFSREEEVIFGSVQRTVLATGVAMMLYACATGHGALMNALLSIKILVPLGRYTFSQWMAHFLFVWYDIFTSRRPFDFMKLPLLNKIIASYGFALCVGYGMFLIFEAPFINLAKSAFGVQSSKPMKNNNIKKLK
ncbi:Nose resistant to fluoxetine protein 6 [Halotydeus destructor]|nr:Nose resistant to fluoxetine protein 6 [Halotydeus destructor]